MNRAFVLAALAAACFPATTPAQEPPSYAKHVRPFLAKYCLECHNSKAAKAGLNLETVKAIQEGSDGGPVLEAGKPDASRIVLLVEGKDKPAMPPAKAKLHPTKAEVAVLRAWVAAGAKDDSAAIKVAIPDIKPHQLRPAPVAALAYSPGGEVLVGGQQARLFWIDPVRGGESAPATDLSKWEAAQKSWQGPPRPARITALAFGSELVIGRGGPGQWADVVRWRDPPVVLNDSHDDLVLDLAVSSQGVVATGSYDTRINLLDLKTGRVRTLKEHSDSVYGVAFSPDGSQLASCSADRAVKVWDVAMGKLLYTLGEATDWLYAVAWSPDGKNLAAGGVDKSIRVYAPGPQGAKLLHSVFAHEAPVQKLLFAKDSQTLYSLGQDGVVKAWDVARMVERKVYERQPETVLCMALRPDGQQLALGRFDGAVVLLDTATGKVQAQVGGAAPAPKAPIPKPPIPKQAAPPKAPAPQVKNVTPAAVSRGRKTVVTFHGAGMDAVDRIDANIPGINVELQPARPESIAAALTIPATTPPGSYQLQLKGARGAATATLIVDAYDAVVEKDAADAPATGQTVLLPVTIVGSLDRTGDVDFFRFEVKQGQALGVQILTAAIGSKLEPALQLTDLAGRVLAESYRGFLGYTFAAAGTYAIGVRDRDLRGGPNMHYRLHLGEIPVVTSFFPLGLQRGTDVDVHLEGVFLTPAKVRVKAPADAAIGSKIAAPVVGKQGTALGTPELVVGAFPEVQPVLLHRKEPPVTLGTIPSPGTANGVVSLPGEAQVWAFPAKKGERLVLETLARRAGSDLDSFLEILDKDGQPVPRAVLRCQAKTFVTFRDHDNGGAGIRIETWNELATHDYLYVGGELMKIQELPPNPDADCTFFNAAGPRLGYLDTTPTHHALNTPMYKVSIHPPGTTFPPNGFPVFTLYYRNDDGGPGYGRDSRLFFDPPADGEYRVRIRDARGMGGASFAYRLTIRPPRPSFNVRFTPTAPAVIKGGAASIAIAIDRLDGYEGPVALHFADLPAGLSAPPTFIDAGTYTTAVALYADAKAELPAKVPPLKLVGEATIDGKPLVKEAMGAAPTLVAPGEVVAVTDESAVNIRPGGQATLTVRIERRAGFAGRVPVEVRGLPHGVHALDIGLNGILVNENETRRTIVLYAEPWVQPSVHPFVVLARSEGKNTEHATKSVLLEVQAK